MLIGLMGLMGLEASHRRYFLIYLLTLRFFLISCISKESVDLVNNINYLLVSFQLRESGQVKEWINMEEIWRNDHNLLHLTLNKVRNVSQGVLHPCIFLFMDREPEVYPWKGVRAQGKETQ